MEARVSCMPPGCSGKVQQGPVAIPALSPVGVVILVLLVAAAGMLAVKR